MQVREAIESDIPEIVSLLRTSLGESLLPKSERIWSFKHIENPFGRSLVMVAVLNHEIIGVRAYMRWKWQIGNEEFNVYRAVDTATLPEHQGKGIFRTLNSTGVEMATENGNHFIFNTPNSQSLPGNLQLGWKKINKIRINLFPQNPFYITGRKHKSVYGINKSVTQSELKSLLETHNSIEIRKNKLFTPKSVEYLQWRYENNPLQDYEVVADKDFYLAGYIKKHEHFDEFRITEHIFAGDVGLKKIRRTVKALNLKFRTLVISSSPEVKLSRILFSGNFGPVLTLRNLNLDREKEKILFNIGNWGYSLGDLELF